MTTSKTILISGAAGNLGAKLRHHLEGQYSLRLLDRQAKGDRAIVEADLSQWDPAWVEQFQGVDTVVHLAADPSASNAWEAVIGPNIDALNYVFTAAGQAGVQRIVYASSNHVMGGYKDIPEPEKITTDLPPRPGTFYERDGQSLNSVPYGTAKLMGERLGKCYADIYGLSFIAVRIGAIRAGDNPASAFPSNRMEWFRLMWLSNRDYCQLMTRCIEADPSIHFAVVNGMSNNTGMRWDLAYTRQLLGYEPQDDISQG
jgi:nucleoside-diphosphate-sugar epimerase